MSEDIDIKVILTPTDIPLKKGRGDRVRLIALHAAISHLLEELRFPTLKYDEGSNPRIGDAHRYFVVSAAYQSAYTQIPSLRPELKLELMQRQPLLPLETLEFGYLYEKIAGLPPSTSLAIYCISVAETTAEKVRSLLRRCAYKWDGHQKRGDLAPALVRHVYDVACIAQKSSDSLQAAKGIFKQLVLSDRDEFKHQNPDFDTDPFGVLRRTLVAAKINGHLQEQYSRQLMPLVYDQNRPSFQQSFEIFETVARDLLSVG